MNIAEQLDKQIDQENSFELPPSSSISKDQNVLTFGINDNETQNILPNKKHVQCDPLSDIDSSLPTKVGLSLPSGYLIQLCTRVG